MVSEASIPRWLEWAREIQALSQTGLYYSETEYHVQRYRRLMEIAAEIVEYQTDLSRQPVLENFVVQPGYATPKVDVRGAVIRDDKILLVQERVDGCWAMPGGWADVGDCPSEMVVREVWEESGFEVQARKVVGVYDANRRGGPLQFYHAYKIVFLCQIVGGEARTSEETLAVDFFPFDGLPPLSVERTSERHLAEVLAHIRDERRPAAFD
jgi:ADP-ribose pyrophosphatase YjhB (NUDIX family)